MQSKPQSERAASDRTGLLPIPRTLGSFVILITVLALTAGRIRNELILTLLGTVFLIVLAYCFTGIFFLGLLQRRKLRSLSMQILTKTVSGEGELCIRAGARFWSLPPILVRCELCLKTRDGRVIRHYASPGIGQYSKFPVKERGAYYGEFDNVVIFDAAGLFRLSLPVQQNKSARLLAFPHPAEKAVSLSLNGGGTRQRNEDHFRKSDELTDHRPYIPGDDPRRINWKLYSHAPLGELFVRQGEPRPPPHSRLLILIDTEADLSLYSLDEGRRAVDLLCENALSAALEFSALGMDILIGCTGGKIIGGNPLNAAEFACALAWPAALFMPGADLPRAYMPRAPQDRGVLIFALPRTFAPDGSAANSSALDRFIKDCEAGQETDIVFLYDAQSRRAAELEDAAMACVNFYNGRPGVHAKRVKGEPFPS